MIYKGNPVSGGIAMGRVYLYRPFSPCGEKVKIDSQRVSEELCRLEKAKKDAAEQLQQVRDQLEDDPDKAKIFTAQLDILFDVAVDEELGDFIRGELLSADTAVFDIYTKYIRILEKSKDSLIRERASDMTDVRNRLLRSLAGVESADLSSLTEQVIVVAEDLFPSDTASMDRSKVLGIVTEVGGATSHTAILSRSFGIPAVLGVAEATQLFEEDEEIILDALEGRIITQPDGGMIETYHKKQQAYRRKIEDTARYLRTKALTKDGIPVEVQLNIGSDREEELTAREYTDGVGLFRSEFLYMERETLPSEEEQEAAYRRVLSAYGDRPVILRTMDIGGDKNLPCLSLPREQNPFLGNRALRYCLSNPHLFDVQLRAALRASVAGNLWLMFPMVGSLDDFRRAKAAVERVKEELTKESRAFSPHVKLGVMIEIPTIALISDLIAREADFASIGTNDLCQYATASDRTNPAVAEYHQDYHPGLLRLIRFAAEEFAKAGKPIGICGEMGGNPLALPVLLGFGMRKFSMNASSVAVCKKMLGQVTVKQAEQLAQEVCAMGTAGEIEAHLKKTLEHML